MTIKKTMVLIMMTLFIIGCSKDEDNDSNFQSINLITVDNPVFFINAIHSHSSLQRYNLKAKGLLV